MRAAGFLKSPLPFAIRGHVLTKNLCSHDHKGVLALAEAGYAHAMYYLADKDYENQNYYEKRDRYEKWMSKATELDYPLAVIDYSSQNLDRERNRISAEEMLTRELKAYKYNPAQALKISWLYSEEGLSNKYLSDAKNEIRGQRIGLTPDKALEEKWKKIWDEQHLEYLKWALISDDHEPGTRINTLYEADFRYLEIATKHGDYSAYINLSNRYLNGTGVPKDKDRAMEYFIEGCRLNIEKGTADDSVPAAFYWSVKLISEGHLDQLDDNDLLQWLQKITISYKENYTSASIGLKTVWPKERIDRLMKSQFELLKTNAESGNAAAQFYYSYNFKRYKERSGNCLKWLLKSAEQGFVNAQYRVAMCYASGDGAPNDSRECLKWLLKAAMQGLNRAQRELVRFYSSNLLLTGDDPLKEDPIDIKDYVEALAWDIVSCDHTGRLDFYKDDMEKLSADDLAKAYRWTKELET
jgi:TPR repeat protein